MTWYLASIGREPLLTPAEEIELGNQVQAMMRLEEQKSEEYSPFERKIIKIGHRSKQRMMKAPGCQRRQEVSGQGARAARSDPGGFPRTGTRR
jgi:Sigma-70 factor, region 1.2